MPEQPNNKQLTNKTDELVKTVRRRFFEEFYAENPDDYEPTDIQRLRTDDWFVKRFIIARFRQEEESLKMINDAMKWRKEYGIHHLSAEYFPKEFYISGGLFPYEKDKFGNATLYMRIKMVKRIPELTPYLRKFLAWQLWKVDEENNGNGWVIIFDTTDAGISNCDIDFLFFMISTLKNYFPIGVEYILVHNLPWVLQQAWKLARNWIPPERRKLVRFSSDSDITDYIDAENLPDYMGGNCKKSYNTAPENSPSCYDFGVNEAKLPLKRVQEIVKQFEQFLPEGYLNAAA